MPAKQYKDAFANYLSPTAKTVQLAQLIENNSDSKFHALQLTSLSAHSFTEYASDEKIYGVVEKFAVSDEMLHKGKGDCDCVAGLIASILNSLDTMKPDEVRVTVGKYLNIFNPNPLEYHAWTEARIDKHWYVLDGTSGNVIPKPCLRYIAMYSIYPNKMTIHDPVIESIAIAPALPILILGEGLSIFS